jgi:desulfoferrodoxin (superoxide reductase-like protein)
MFRGTRMAEKNSEESEVAVKVGRTEHPTEENQYIEWVELNVAGKVSSQLLNPGKAPEVTFIFKIETDPDTEQKYCYCRGAKVRRT